MDHRKAFRQRRYRFLLIFLFIFILAAVVPMAVILPRRKQNWESNVILPLYIYPFDNSTWQPLYDAAEQHPELNFTVIINPASGPGSTPSPNSNYIAQITQLNLYPNVKMVGYVRTGYATNNLTEVIAEVNRYAGWSSISNSLAMHGIFCDEAPHQYDENAAEYMRALNVAIKSAKGLGDDPMVIHNPGVVPDPIFDDNTTDVTVVFEENYTVWPERQEQVDSQTQRTANAVMVHSIPNMPEGDLTGFVHQLAAKAEYLFVTDNSQDYYESFGPNWANFTEAAAVY